MTATHGLAAAPTASRRTLVGVGARSATMVLDRLCSLLLTVTLIGTCGIAFSNVVARVVTGSSLYWSDTACEIGLAVLAFLGAVTSFVRNDHAGMRGLRNRVSARLQPHFGAAISIVILFAALVMARQGIHMLQQSNLGTFPATGWPVQVLYIPLTVGGVILAITAIASYFHGGVRRIPWVGIVVAVIVVAGFWIYVQQTNGEAGDVEALIATGIIVVLSIAVGTPVAFALLVGAVAGMSMQSQPLQQVPLQMTNEMTQVSLLSLPLFILVGVLYAELGYSENLAEFFRRIGRRVPAADGMAMVGAMFVFSGLSGSKLADVSAVGKAFVGKEEEARTGGAAIAAGAAPAAGEAADMAVDDVVGRAETSAILSAAAVMGEVIVPSIAMLILGSVTTISTGALFVAGLLPAVVVGAIIILFAMLRAGKLPSAHFGAGATPMSKLVVRGIPAVTGIVLIAGSVISGIATAEEASAVAAVYSIVLSVAYRIRPRALWNAIETAARLSGMILFIIAAAGVLSWFLTVSGLSTYVTNLSSAVGGNKELFMLAMMVILIVLGSAFEGLPAIILLAPILVPQASALGINPVQTGIVLLLAMGVGIFLPPLGNGFYTSCTACRVQPERALKSTFIYMLPVCAGALIVAFIPSVSLWLPKVVGVS